MDGNADVILKETHQGKAITAAVLDVCYPVAKNSDRKDRFVVNLAVNGQALTGTTQSNGEKAPVNVKLTQKTNGDSVEFRGQITIGQAVTEVASTDNSDISEKEYQDSQSTDDGISAQPKDFTEVSPEAVAVRLKLDAAVDFLKSLKGQEVEVGLSSLTVGCDALRAGEQTISMSVDPDRAAALIAKAKAMPGVVAAGWTTGIVEMDRTLRFPAAEWREGDKINKDKLAAAVSDVLAKTYGAKATGTSWSATTGKLRAELQAAQSIDARPRPDGDDRGHRAGRARQAGRHGRTDAMGRQSGDDHGRRNRRREAHHRRRILRRRRERATRR